jgi:hypothetical protein
MIEVTTRRGRRKARELRAAAAAYAAMGWPVCAGAYPLADTVRLRGPQQRRDAGRACSCDRVGCPDPGAHPISPAWQREASADPAVIARWWGDWPDANVVLVTGRVFDVLEVSATAGRIAIDSFAQVGAEAGPVAAWGPDRYLFLVATRGAPADEDEWWSCHLDCVPDSIADTPGIGWHCRDSYVLAPPSRHISGQQAHWIRAPAGGALPDSLRVLPVLVDACEEAERR